MDLKDLLPFIVGGLYLFFKARKKQTEDIEEIPTPPVKKKNRPAPPVTSLEEVLKELMIPVPAKEKKPVNTDMRDQDYRQKSWETKDSDIKPQGHTFEKNLARKAKTGTKLGEETQAWDYEDKIEHTSKESTLHKKFDRHIAVEVETLHSEDIDLRQAVVYDAILHRPDF